METQTDLIVVDRLTPIVSFLDSSECTLEPSSISHCFQYRPDRNFLNRIIFLPEITDDEVKELQAEDADLGSIVKWLKEGRQPNSDYLKFKSLDTRTLWAQVPAIHLLDGILVHKFSDQCVIQLVVPTALRRRLFELTHAGPLAAHLRPQ